MSANRINGSFAGTRIVDVVVVMIASLFFVNVIFFAPTDQSETVSIYAAELQAGKAQN